MTTYRRDPVKAPVLKGFAFRTFVKVLESPAGRLLLDKLTADSGIGVFREADLGTYSPVQEPLPWPAHVPARRPAEALVEEAAKAAAKPKGPALETAADFAKAYREGKTDPTQVVRRLEGHIRELDEGPHRLALFISRKPDELAKAAEESAERLRRGSARGPLEGVPVVVKDELDMAGFVTTLGTRFRTEVAQKDATVVARLKAAGALVLGKANMHEIGILPIGHNSWYGVCRNPWDRSRHTGGSSSASAAAVACGLAPISIGCDGGGSIRIPAALCGVVGLKATWNRISELGVPPLCWNVGHAGPLGQTVGDVAAAYAAIAGPDIDEPITTRQPPPHLEGLADGNLKGVRLGICRPYFEDAEPDVVKACQRAVDACVAAGATVVEVPPPDLPLITWSHRIIIYSEMAAAMMKPMAEDTTRFGLDVRVSLAIGRHYGSTDVVHAMRYRARLTHELLAQLKHVDAFVTPTTGCTAPPIPEDAQPDGESNLPLVDPLMRFAAQGNLTGFPALSVPAGYDARGLPVGVQFMGRPWEEHLLFRLGRVVEASVERRLPAVHVGALG